MSAPSTTDSYLRTDDFESRIESVLLPNEAWAVFAHLEKPITCAEIARRVETDPEAVQKTINLLVEQKLARKHLMNWRDFLAQKGINTGPSRMSPAGPQAAPVARVVSAAATAPATPAPATAAPINGAASSPAPARPVPAAPSRATVIARRPEPRVPTPEPPDPEGTITFTLANENARRTRRANASMTITFRLAPKPVTPATRVAPIQPPAAPATRRELASAPAATARVSVAPRKLRPLIDAITRKGGGGLNGQLLVYRVFLRVPPSLMYNAGIKSLSLVDDSLELRDDQFYDAIRSAAQSVASLDLDTVCV